MNSNFNQKGFSILKLIGLIAVGFVAIIILLAIIGGNGQQQEKITETEKITTGYSISQDVRVGDVRWKLIDVKDRGNILKASESRFSIIANDKTTTGKFIEITMEVENLSKEMKSFSDLRLVDNKNREFIPASGVSEWIPEDKELFLLSNLNPNMPQQFSSIYEIPIDATDLKVKVGDLSFWGEYEASISLGL